jgi:phosphoenolpyruvate synthase/pyruvate phosphate dikinase
LIEKEFLAPKLGEKLMKGIAASPGVAMGRVCIHKDIFSHVSTRDVKEQMRAVEETLCIVQEEVGHLEAEHCKKAKETH